MKCALCRDPDKKEEEQKEHEVSKMFKWKGELMHICQDCYTKIYYNDNAKRMSDDLTAPFEVEEL